MTRSKVLIYGITTGYLYFIINVLINVMMVPVMLHFLGGVEYGLWVTIISIVGYIGILDLGSGISVGKYVAEYRSQSEKANISDLAITSLIVFTILGALAFAVIAFLSFFITDFFALSGNLGRVTSLAFLVAGLNMAISFPSNAVGGIIFGHQKLAANHLISILGVIINFALLFWLLKNGLGLIGIPFALLLTTLLIIMIRIIYLKSILPNILRFEGRFNGKIFRQIFSFSFFMFILSIGGQIVFNTDNIVIAKLLGVGLVASYSIAFKANQVLMVFVYKLADAFFPFFSELSVIGERDKLSRYFTECTRFSVALATPLFFILLFWGENIINLWVGRGNFIGTAVFYLMALIMLMGSIIHAGAVALQGIGKVRTLVIFNLLEAAFNLGFSIILALRYGIVGVALGTVLAMFFTNLWYVPFRACREIKIPILEYLLKSILSPFALGLVLVAFFLLANLVIIDNNMWAIALKTTIALALYFTCFIRFVMSNKERSFYLGKLKNAIIFLRS